MSRRFAKGPRVHWGMLGVGNIARHAVAPALEASCNGRVVAVASRVAERAAELARDLGIDRGHPTYASLLEDSNVEAVYLGMPNGLHYEWAKKSLQAGKHVLCEKALTLDLRQAEELRTLASSKGLLLAEAYMYRHHPQWTMVRDKLREGIIGELRGVDVVFCNPLGNEDDHRWSGELGGGALFDLTCYGVDVCRFVTGKEPDSIKAVARPHGNAGVDRATAVTMRFPGGVLGNAIGSLDEHGHQRVTLIGTTGTILLTAPFSPGWGPTLAKCSWGTSEQELTTSGANHYFHMVEHMSWCILDPNRALAPMEDGVANTRALCAARDSWTEDK